ncbi:MAG TPA: hypothetical protein VF116_11655 [Ktedonobacterales bacterium]
MEWVVRGGVATADRLGKGYGEHRRMKGTYGFSVQCAPGKTVEELAQAGRIRNGQLSFATVDDLRAALQPLGYAMRLVKSPGQGFHHTFAVLYDATGAMLRALPDDAAQTLQQVFRQRPNPYRLP